MVKATVCKTVQSGVQFPYCPPEMKREELAEIAAEIKNIACGLGWNQEDYYIASTGSIYLDLTRKHGEQKEWVVIRIADHKKVYNRWLTTYSWSPYEYNEEMLADVLKGEFGSVGDVFSNR